MKHLAIIADGNRRWARQNGLSIKQGYFYGLETIEKICDWAIKNNIDFLSFFCFSTENWGRPKEEVEDMMSLIREYSPKIAKQILKKKVRIQFIGRNDRFSKDIVKLINFLQNLFKGNAALTLNIYIDYGGRDEIISAISKGARTEKEIDLELTKYAPFPDAILRTGGQMRLSNFMLWQAAYAELFFSETLFPALTENELDEILLDFQGRKRNYGK